MPEPGLEDMQMDRVDVVKQGVCQHGADSVQPQLRGFFRVDLLTLAVLEIDYMQLATSNDQAVGCTKAPWGNTRQVKLCFGGHVGLRIKPMHNAFYVIQVRIGVGQHLRIVHRILL